MQNTQVSIFDEIISDVIDLGNTLRKLDHNEEIIDKAALKSCSGKIFDLMGKVMKRAEEEKKEREFVSEMRVCPRFTDPLSFEHVPY